MPESSSMLRRLCVSRIRPALRNGIVGAALTILIGCSPKPQDLSAYSGPAVATQEMQEGLKVETMQAGQGPKAKKGDFAKIHYITRVQGGAEIARSHDDAPKYVLVGRDAEYVEGLHLGLMGVQKGELRKITVPKSLGYRGRKDPKVPPDATLEFFVEVFALSEGEY